MIAHRPALRRRGGLHRHRAEERSKDCQVGDTITLADTPAEMAAARLPPRQAMVFAGLYPVESTDYPLLRDALEKLKLNDASLSYEPETSAGPGLRLPLRLPGPAAHGDRQERLEREYNLSLLITAPSVEYKVLTIHGQELRGGQPRRPAAGGRHRRDPRSPAMKISIVTPSRYIGAIMELVTGRRGDLRAHGVPGRAAGPPQLPHPAVRDADRLLRHAQEPHPGLRLPGLQLRRLPSRPTWSSWTSW